MDTNTRYCVFWFPTIFHCEKKNRIKGNSVGPYGIDDKSNDKELSLEITREEQKTDNQNLKDRSLNNCSVSATSVSRILPSGA